MQYETLYVQLPGITGLMSNYMNVGKYFTSNPRDPTNNICS